MTNGIWHIDTSRYRLTLNIVVFALLTIFINSTIIPYFNFNEIEISYLEPTEESEKEEKENEKEFKYEGPYLNEVTSILNSSMVFLSTNDLRLSDNYGEIVTPPPELS